MENKLKSHYVNLFFMIDLWATECCFEASVIRIDFYVSNSLYRFPFLADTWSVNDYGS